ncbi:MAG: hypothetical protein V4807_12320 [Burkholderia gladioli]|uniref:hypothetical protein n=1 Tax=Burkholderia gladioli TaxID=28095 RepID=UPI00286270C3|nr:hypothetical protein [Burkholderia gladioli]MDR8091077.1 hypothetical protein [Burkholderia gladioli]
MQTPAFVRKSWKFVGAFAVIAAVLYLAPHDPNDPNKAPGPAPVVPAVQTQLEGLWSDGAQQYAAGANEIIKSRTFNGVSVETNTLLGAGDHNKMRRWYATITDITTSHGGDTASATFRGPGGAVYRMESSVYSDTPIYKSLAGMTVGQHVYLSGILLMDGEQTEGGVQKWERSATEAGAFDRPEFVVILDSIESAPDPVDAQ